MIKKYTYEVKLSIVMMTFNQGEFIRDAIDSVLKQYKPFTWELHIGDDNSKDNTQTVISDYLELYSNIFYHKNSENIGLHQNYITLIQKTKGEFIALLEADDYWIDEKKCYYQIQQLEENPTIAWSFTNSITVDQNKNTLNQSDYKLPEKFNLDFFVINFFNPPSNSIIFRKDAEPNNYPDFFLKIIQWDTTLLYLRLLTQNNKYSEIGFVNILGLAWRRHSAATSTTLFSGEKRYKDWIILNNELKKRVPVHLKKHFNKNYVAYENLFLLFLKKMNYRKSICYFLKMLFNKPLRPAKEYKDLFWKIKNL